jgi:hypothetical protein
MTKTTRARWASITKAGLRAEAAKAQRAAADAADARAAASRVVGTAIDNILAREAASTVVSAAFANILKKEAAALEEAACRAAAAQVVSVSLNNILEEEAATLAAAADEVSVELGGGKGARGQPAPVLSSPAFRPVSTSNNPLITDLPPPQSPPTQTAGGRPQPALCLQPAERPPAGRR